MAFFQDGAGEGGGINDPSEFGSEKENAKDFALWKVRIGYVIFISLPGSRHSHIRSPRWRIRLSSSLV